MDKNQDRSTTTLFLLPMEISSYHIIDLLHFRDQLSFKLMCKRTHMTTIITNFDDSYYAQFIHLYKRYAKCIASCIIVSPRLTSVSYSKITLRYLFIDSHNISQKGIEHCTKLTHLTMGNICPKIKSLAFASNLVELCAKSVIKKGTMKNNLLKKKYNFQKMVMDTASPKLQSMALHKFSAGNFNIKRFESLKKLTLTESNVDLKCVESCRSLRYLWYESKGYSNDTRIFTFTQLDELHLMSIFVNHNTFICDNLGILCIKNSGVTCSVVRCNVIKEMVIIDSITDVILLPNRVQLAIYKHITHVINMKISLHVKKNIVTHLYSLVTLSNIKCDHIYTNYEPKNRSNIKFLHLPETAMSPIYPNNDNHKHIMYKDKNGVYVNIFEHTYYDSTEFPYCLGANAGGLFKNTTHLKMIEQHTNNKISSFGDITTTLTNLSLRNSRSLRNDKFNLINLVKLCLCHVKNVTDINSCTKLKYLSLLACDVTQEGIKECKNVVSLYIHKCPHITDINHMTELTTLITDTSSLNTKSIKKCSKLTIIYAKNQPNFYKIRHRLGMFSCPSNQTSVVVLYNKTLGVPHNKKLLHLTDPEIKELYYKKAQIRPYLGDVLYSFHNKEIMDSFLALP